MINFVKLMFVLYFLFVFSFLSDLYWILIGDILVFVKECKYTKYWLISKVCISFRPNASGVVRGGGRRHNGVLGAPNWKDKNRLTQKSVIDWKKMSTGKKLEGC